MWITLLVMAAATSIEPFRIGMTLLMLNRPRPLLQLAAFLSGGFTMGTAGGLLVIFLFRPALAGSSAVSLPRVQLLIGGLALLAAAVVAIRVVLGRSRDPAPAPLGAGPGPSRLSARARQLLNGRSLWVAGTAGLGIALPSVDYLAALAIIVSSGAAVQTQVSALLMFNAVAFALVEIPLVAYLIAPDATRTAMVTLNNWIRRRRPHQVAALLAVVGIVLLTAGAVNM